MKKLLIADGQVDLLKLLEAVFRGEGRTVLLAENGIDALELARQELPDVMLPGGKTATMWHGPSRATVGPKGALSLS